MEVKLGSLPAPMISGCFLGGTDRKPSPRLCYSRVQVAFQVSLVFKCRMLIFKVPFQVPSGFEVPSQNSTGVLHVSKRCFKCHLISSVACLFQVLFSSAVWFFKYSAVFQYRFPNVFQYRFPNVFNRHFKCRSSAEVICTYAES